MVEVRTRRAAGFTVIELCIALLLLVVLFTKLTWIVDEASDTQRRETLAMALEDQALGQAIRLLSPVSAVQKVSRDLTLSHALEPRPPRWIPLHCNPQARC